MTYSHVELKRAEDSHPAQLGLLIATTSHHPSPPERCVSAIQPLHFLRELLQCAQDEAAALAAWS